MSESNNEQRSSSNGVAIVAIVVAGIVILACIVALSAVALAFMRNAPW